MDIILDCLPLSLPFTVTPPPPHTHTRFPFSLPLVQVEAAIYKLHTRRCCTLEFHPGRDSIVVSGDKKGGIAVWDFDKVGRKCCLWGLWKLCILNSRSNGTPTLCPWPFFIVWQSASPVRCLLRCLMKQASRAPPLRPPSGARAHHLQRRPQLPLQPDQGAHLCVGGGGGRGRG